MKIVFACLIFIMTVSLVWARGPGWALSMPTFGDEGDTAIPLTLTVGEVTPVSPFDPDPLKDRAWFLQNPHPTCDLFVGTFSALTVDSPHWFVPSSSGSFAASNHQKIWLIYPTGCGSQTVVGGVLQQ
jgi:hypothetical protein